MTGPWNTNTDDRHGSTAWYMASASSGSPARELETEVMAGGVEGAGGVGGVGGGAERRREGGRTGRKGRRPGRAERHPSEKSALRLLLRDSWCSPTRQDETRNAETKRKHLPCPVSAQIDRKRQKYYSQKGSSESAQQSYRSFPFLGH